MEARRFCSRLFAGRRACVAGLLLPVIIAGACGVPIFPIVIKERSQPYPCQDCPCPCADAESCWRRCCCMSDEQKLAWAQRHGVTPPAFFLAQAAAKSRPADPAAPTSPKCCCSCGKKPARARVAPRDARPGVVLLSAQYRCLGAGGCIAVLPPALPCPPSVPWIPEELLVCWVASYDARGDSLRFEPPEPPPRHVFVSVQSAAWH